MRGALKYGVPIAAGLATGGYALSQGEDPGSAVLAGLAGGLGGAAGLLGARALAGKYAPAVADVINTGKKATIQGLTSASQNVYPQIKLSTGTNLSAEEAAQLALANKARANRAGESKRVALLGGIAGALQGIPQATEASVYSGLKKGLGAVAVPASALTAGLGGVALGAIPGSMGVPGFVQSGAVDPESYGSSNSPGARYKAPTLQYLP